MEIVCICEALPTQSLDLLKHAITRSLCTTAVLVNGREPTAAGRNVVLCALSATNQLKILCTPTPADRFELR